MLDRLAKERLELVEQLDLLESGSHPKSSFLDVWRLRRRFLRRIEVLDQMHLAHAEQVQQEQGDKNAERVARCRVILRLAHRVLPEGAREDVLDEWMDEIETAVENEKRVFRRLVSIVRSVPAMAWRSQRAARARRGGG